MKNINEAHEKRECESKEEAKIKMGDHQRATSPFTNYSVDPYMLQESVNKNVEAKKQELSSRNAAHAPLRWL